MFTIAKNRGELNLEDHFYFLLVIVVAAIGISLMITQGLAVDFSSTGEAFFSNLEWTVAQEKLNLFEVDDSSEEESEDESSEEEEDPLPEEGDYVSLEESESGEEESSEGFVFKARPQWIIEDIMIYSLKQGVD